jgi:hypothetical protein
MLTTNQDFNEDVIFSIPSSGADIDKFSLDEEDNTVLHFHPVDFETEKKTYSVEVTARRTDTNKTTKTITVTVTDLDDEAPTNIRINGPGVIDGQVALANNKGDDFFIGTLSATDPDTDTTTNALTFTIDNSPDFEIVNTLLSSPSRPNLSISAPLGIEKITSAFSLKSWLVVSTINSLGTSYPYYI